MIALIDGDVILYQAAWKNDYFGAQKKCIEILTNLVEATFATTYMGALGGPDNFRDELYVNYKKSASRLNSKSVKAEYHNDLKYWFAEQEGMYLTKGIEADDQIYIWANEAKAAGDPFAICTVDKDLDTIPGLHFNNRKEEYYTITPDQASFKYWMQLLTGDAVDNIPGLAGIGPVKAAAILQDATTDEQRKEAVISAYKSRYNDQWQDYYLANGKLLHIQRFHNDFFHLGGNGYA